MGFEAVALCELGMADIAFVRFFARVNPEMPFKLKGVRTGIRALGTLLEKKYLITKLASSMTHSARPTVSPVMNIVFTRRLFCLARF